MALKEPLILYTLLQRRRVNLEQLKAPPLEKMRSEGSKFAEGKLMGKEVEVYPPPLEEGIKKRLSKRETNCLLLWRRV